MLAGDERGDAASAFQRLHPRVFLERFVTQGVRPDGRGLQDVRECSVTHGVVPSADGSAQVQQGGTVVVCGVRFMVDGTERAIDQEDAGSISVVVHLSPICSPEYEIGKTSPKAVSLAAFLTRVLDSKVVDLGSLCIEPGVARLNLICDVVCLSDDGNLRDASLSALVEALQQVRLPVFKLLEKSDDTSTAAAVSEVVQVGTTKPNSVPLIHTPISTTFGIFGKDTLLRDPNFEESQVLDGTISVVANEKGDILSVYKISGPELSLSILNTCMEIATENAQ